MASTALVDRTFQNEKSSPELSSNWNDQRADGLWEGSFAVTTAVHEFHPRSSTPLLVPVENPDIKPQTSIELISARIENAVISIPHTFKAKTIAGRSVNTLQEWEGLVDEIAGDYFIARLRDLTKPDRPEEIAEITFDGIDPTDIDRVRPGAVFHLIVGYTRRNGSQRLETFTYFRRHLPPGRETATEIVEMLDMLEGDVD